MTNRAQTSGSTEFRAGGPIFITGLSHTGKTELRRVIERHPDVWMVRKSDIWASARGIEGLTRAGEEFNTRASSLGSQRWGLQQKGLEFRLGEVLHVWPEARIVHLVRDPRSLDGLVDSAGRAGWALARWVNSARALLTHVAREPHRVRIVHTEALASGPGRIVREVADFLGLAVTPEMEQMIRTVAWERLLRDDRSEAALGVGERYRKALGYGPSDGPSARPALELVTYMIGRLTGLTRWRMR
ncbi:MAG TPA: sulfotransferase [Acidimicrobiia bacterium]|nr:sulfotransferase [Acidimicrobiia bacterium]